MYDTFIDRCLNGSAGLEDVDSYVERWHTEEIGVSLREYLGMRPDEYERWLREGDDVLPVIVEERKKRLSQKSVRLYLFCPRCGRKMYGIYGAYRFRCPSCGCAMRAERQSAF